MTSCNVANCNSPQKAKGFCNKHWWRQHNGKPLQESTTEQKFWSNAQKGEPDECWLWLGATRGKGQRLYGVFWVSGVGHVSAHRYSYELANGQIHELPEADCRGTCVLHQCDTPLCINPGHLFTGTHTDNMQDKVAKKRDNGSASHCRRGHEFTEANTWVSKQELRHCRTCHRQRQQRYNAAKKAAGG